MALIYHLKYYWGGTGLDWNAILIGKREKKYAEFRSMEETVRSERSYGKGEKHKEKNEDNEGRGIYTELGQR